MTAVISLKTLAEKLHIYIDPVAVIMEVIENHFKNDKNFRIRANQAGSFYICASDLLAAIQSCYGYDLDREYCSTLFAVWRRDEDKIVAEFRAGGWEVSFTDGRYNSFFKVAWDMDKADES